MWGRGPAQRKQSLKKKIIIVYNIYGTAFLRPILASLNKVKQRREKHQRAWNLGIIFKSLQIITYGSRCFVLLLIPEETISHCKNFGKDKLQGLHNIHVFFLFFKQLLLGRVFSNSPMSKITLGQTHHVVTTSPLSHVHSENTDFRDRGGAARLTQEKTYSRNWLKTFLLI